MTLYCDPSVKFGGVALGGVRISHMSNILSPMSMMLTTTRSRRSEYTVQPLIEEIAKYPDELFKQKSQAMIEAIKSGSMKLSDVIARCKKDGGLTDAQIKVLRDATVKQ
jgi:hypothetical protein